MNVYIGKYELYPCITLINYTIRVLVLCVIIPDKPDIKNAS